MWCEFTGRQHLYGKLWLPSCLKCDIKHTVLTDCVCLLHCWLWLLLWGMLVVLRCAVCQCIAWLAVCFGVVRSHGCLCLCVCGCGVCEWRVFVMCVCMRACTMYRSAMLENIGIRTKTARSVGFSRSENLRNAMEFDVGNYFDFVGHMSGFCSGFSYFLERFYGENIQIELFVGNCIFFVWICYQILRSSYK